MKKTFFSLLATLAILPVWFSCTEKELDIPVMDVPSAEAVYEYRLEISDSDTRATLGEDGVYWQNGDQVGLFVKKGDSPSEYVDAHVSVQEGSTPAVVFTTHSALDETANIYAYHSSPLQSSTSEGAAQIVFPDAQQGGSASAMPLAGIPTQFQQGESNGVVRFLNLGSVIDFRVYSTDYAGARIQSITLEATSDNGFVSGTASLDLNSVSRNDEGFPSFTWTEGKTSVTLTQDATVALNKDAAASNHLYMVVAPGSFSGTITVVTNDASYSFPFSATFKRNGIKRLNLSLESVNATKRNEYVRVSDSSSLVSGGTYLIVYESGSKAFHPKKSNNSFSTSNNAESVSIMDNRIWVDVGSEVDNSRVILEQSSGLDFYIKVPSADNSYFYLSNSAFNVGKNASTIDFSGNNVTIKRSGSRNYYLVYRNAAFTSYNQSSTLALYRLNKAVLTSQNLAFSASFFKCNISGQQLPVTNVAGIPSLSGAQTLVAYYSSDPSVASVSSDGSITVWKTGEAVITAVAEASDLYQQGMASYSIKVEDGFNVENDKVETYLDLVDAQPYNPPADYSFTHMTADLQSGNTDHTNRLDWPKPVPVSWTTSATGTPTIVVYDGSGQEEKMANVTVTTPTSADIYNLIPGRTYTYVVKDGNTQIGEGSIKTVGRRRMIKVGDSPYGKMYANNCRDFGGQITQDGRRIKYGKMFRGSNMDQITNVQKLYLKNDMKIGLDVDLRNSGSNAGAGENVLYDALGLEDWHTTKTFNSWKDFHDEFSDGYKMTTILSKVFQAVAANKGVYIHCMVGADRTGYVCMLLEAILGVEQGWCDVDYELTSFSGAVDSGKGRWRVGDYPSTINNTLSANWYYRSKNGTTQGVDFIYELPVGDYGTVYPNNSFQAKAVNYVVNTLGIPFADIQAFQNNMLEENN